MTKSSFTFNRVRREVGVLPTPDTANLNSHLWKKDSSQEVAKNVRAGDFGNLSPEEQKGYAAFAISYGVMAIVTPLMGGSIGVQGDTSRLDNTHSTIGPDNGVLDGLSVQGGNTGNVYDSSPFSLADPLAYRAIGMVIDMYDVGIDPIFGDTHKAEVQSVAAELGIKNPRLIKRGLSGLAEGMIKMDEKAGVTPSESLFKVLALVAGHFTYDDETKTYTHRGFEVGNDGRKHLVKTPGWTPEQVKAEVLNPAKIVKRLGDVFLNKAPWEDPPKLPPPSSNEQPAGDENTTQETASPELNPNIDYPEVGLSSPDLALDFLNVCLSEDECRNVDKESVVGWQLGENNLMFYKYTDPETKTEEIRGRILHDDKWFPIFLVDPKDNGGDYMNQYWFIPTSKVGEPTPQSPSSDTGVDMFFSIHLTEAVNGGNIIVQFKDPFNPDAENEIFILSPKSDIWERLHIASVDGLPSGQPPLETPVAYPFLEAMDELLVKGIGTTAEDIPDSYLLQLTTVGEDGEQTPVPDAFIDENGENLLVKDVEGNVIAVPIEGVAGRIDKTPSGLLVLKDVDGIPMALFNSSNPEGRWIFANKDTESEKITFTDSEGKGWVWDGQRLIDSQAYELFNEHGFDLSIVDFEDTDGVVRGFDKETGDLVYEDEKFDIRWAVLHLDTSDLMKTPFKPIKEVGVPLQGDYNFYFRPLAFEISNQLESDGEETGSLNSHRIILLDPVRLAWGHLLSEGNDELKVSDERYFGYQKSSGEILWFKVMEMDDTQFKEFKIARGLLAFDN